MKLRVACVQFNPLLGELEHNKNIISALLKKTPEFDLVVLPELSITGYSFKDANHIKPFLDTDTQSPSTQFGKEILKKYGCFTVIGLPESTGGQIFNSAKLINPLGEVVVNYHKTFLFETDEAWGCVENPDKSFKSVDVILNKDYYSGLTNEKHIVRLNLGICMDLNPYKFTAPFTNFEFSRACYNNKSQLIICPMAWLSPKSPSVDKTRAFDQRVQQAEAFKKYFNESDTHINTKQSDNYDFTPRDTPFDPKKADYSTVNYHILRFFPFINHPNNPLPKYGNVNVVVCNRTGIENDVMYGGSSSIFEFVNVPGNDKIDHQNPSVDLKGYLGQANQGVLYREINV